MAICSKCLNVTSSVKKTCNNESGCYRFLLPGGPSLSGFGGQINSSVSHVSKDLDEIEASVVRFSSLFSRRINSSDTVLAWECVLSYCINTYLASVTNGDLEQRIEETWLNNSASHSQGSDDLIYNPPQSIANLSANASTFKVGGLAAKAMNSKALVRTSFPCLIERSSLKVYAGANPPSQVSRSIDYAYDSDLSSTNGNTNS